VILEIDLNDLVGESEHDGVLGTHPFLDVYTTRRVLELVGLVQQVSLYQLFLLLGIVILFKIRFEMLEQSDFFLELLREVRETVLRHHILLLVCSNCFPLVVVELCST
jgi:hypothetical protein